MPVCDHPATQIVQRSDVACHWGFAPCGSPRTLRTGLNELRERGSR